MDTNEVLWLDAEQMRTWLSTVAAMEAFLSALDAQLKTDVGINRFEYSILAMLSTSQDDALAMSDLAGVAFGSLSRLSHAVSRLERRGWVQRSAGPSGRRSTIARLTDLGRRELEAAAPGHVREVRRLLIEPLTADEFHLLGVISAKILETIEPGRRDDLERIMSRLTG